MRTLIVLLVLILSSVMPGDTMAQVKDPTRIDAVIENVEVVSEAPLILRVVGHYPANCDMPSNYEVEQWGNEVRMSMFQVAASGVPCHDDYTPFREITPEYLFADLTPGTYYLNINGYALRAQVREQPPIPPTPFPPPPSIPPVPQYIEQVLCVGDRLQVDPRSPTELYHYIDVNFHDVTPRRGEVSVQYARGSVQLLKDTSRILAYLPTRHFGLSFEAIREGEVTGSMHVLTESMSPYGYTYMLLAEYRIHVLDCDYPPPPPPIPPDPIRAYAVIESVDPLVLESYPMQIHLHVKGYYGTGCQNPVQIDQWREGNRVYVEIYQVVNPQLVCPQRLVWFDEVIPLKGGFVSGTYSIRVNDFQVWVDL